MIDPHDLKVQSVANALNLTEEQTRLLRSLSDDCIAMGRLQATVTPADPNYLELCRILGEVYVQVAEGKGLRKHAMNNAFEEQDVFVVGSAVGEGFMLGQAFKKFREGWRTSERGDFTDGKRDLIGAIAYIASAIIFLEKEYQRGNLVLIDDAPLEAIAVSGH